MPRSKSRKKIYFYLFILLLLSSTFNFNIISKFKKSILISHINIVGLNEKEKNNLEKSLKIFMNKNIFFISKDEVLRILKKNNFLDSYNIVKIFPSKIFIYAKKYCNGKVGSILEGGYNIQSTAKAANEHVNALLELDN